MRKFTDCAQTWAHITKQHLSSSSLTTIKKQKLFKVTDPRMNDIWFGSQEAPTDAPGPNYDIYIFGSNIFDAFVNLGLWQFGILVERETDTDDIIVSEENMDFSPYYFHICGSWTCAQSFEELVLDIENGLRKCNLMEEVEEDVVANISTELVRVSRHVLVSTRDSLFYQEQ